MTSHTQQSALAALLTVAARVAGRDNAALAVSNELRTLLDADVIDVVTGPAPRRHWQSARTGGTAVSDAANDAPVPEGSIVVGEYRLNAGGHEDGHGSLTVHRSAPLTDAEAELCRGCADLLTVLADRDHQLESLRREVDARASEVAENRVFIERVVDALPFGLYVVDRDYRIHAWNHQRETGVQGVSRSEAMGRTIFDVLQRQPAALLKREFDEVFTTGRLQQFQMESNAFGETRTFRISKIPLRVRDEAVSHVITVGEDVTEWRAAIDRIAQSEKLAAIGQLAAGVMHEINNPLATIAACGESLALNRELTASLPPGSPVPGADPNELLRIIDVEVQRCKRIIDGLLDFARPKPAQRDTLDVNAIVRQGLFLLQHHPRFKRVQVVTQLDESRALLTSGDADQIVQVLIALCINALDASPDNGQIRIRSAAVQDHEEPQVLFEVSDDGPGVPRALQAKVFEPFFTTKAQGKGTGLGLAICYGIVTDHAGELELESPEGAGATFRVRLPDAAMSLGRGDRK